MRRLPIQSPNRRGAAAVEMAIVLPIFFMVVMGIVEFGRAMMVGQLVTNAARYGARESAVDGATNATVTTAVKNFVSTSVGVAATDVTVDIIVTPGAGNPDPANNLSMAQAKDVCKVSVKVPYNKVAYIAGRYLAGKDLKGMCIMRHE
jgi:Flp pilus assembly protein TadG